MLSIISLQQLIRQLPLLSLRAHTMLKISMRNALEMQSQTISCIHLNSINSLQKLLTLFLLSTKFSDHLTHFKFFTRGNNDHLIKHRPHITSEVKLK